VGAPKEANRITRILDAFAAANGTPRFPVDVRALALDCANLNRWSDPITEVKAADINRFEGALHPSRDRTRWLLLYNSAIRSPGRVRFTQAHELGHYILHRQKRDAFNCTQENMLDWSVSGESMESEADEFASYLLMPLSDYRNQVADEVDFDLMGHCANRYGVSLTAAILKWLSYTPEKAVVVMSRDGYMQWASSSTPAFKAGAFFRTRNSTVPIPPGSITADVTISEERRGANVPATTWFSHAEPQQPLREMKLYSDHYESVLTLLVLARSATVWPPCRNED
jgi:IrrE N-terminal-like domain